jgi:hypothetical protein
MRSLVLLSCSLVTAVAAAAAAGAVRPDAGMLSVERAKGTVILEIRGAVLGRLAVGTLRVTDTTPRDRFEPLVVGRRLTEETISSTTVVYRGAGIRFRMVGGGTRIVARGAGISISAVGRGTVVLDADRKLPTEDAGVYSLEGVDCQVEPESCLPLPETATRFVLAPPGGEATRAR